jgi:hypothetical protein
MKKIVTLSLLVLSIHALAQPTITSFSPTSGPIGTTVMIFGTNFNTTPANNIVFFGATKASVILVRSDTITATVPAGATYQPISVTNIATGLTAYSSRPFITTFACGGRIDTSSFANDILYVTGSYPYYISCGDLDGDGKPDLAIANQSSGTISVLRNISTSGTINFASQVFFTVGSSPAGISIGDINGDGKPDLVVANQSSGTVSVLRNTSSISSISFASKVDLTTGSNPISVSLGDFDSDGKPDLAVAISSTDKVSVFRNISSSSTISFAAKVDYTTGGGVVRVTNGDIDGDNKPDLAVVNYSSNSVSILRNNSTVGNISFEAKIDLVTGNSPWGVSIGDMDGDGKQDLAVANAYSYSLSIFRNTSSVYTVSFAPKVDFALGSGPECLVMGDLDGDGKPDLVFGNKYSSIGSVLKNTSSVGLVSFESKVDFTTGLNPCSVSIGDLNGDGKPDLAFSNYGSNSVSVLKNTDDKLPAAFITQDDLILTSNDTLGNQWYDQNGIIIGATDQSYTVTGNGSYYVIVTYPGCGTQQSNTITISTYSIATIDEDIAIKLYPNPVKDELTIEIESNKEDIDYKIYNSTGQMVSQGNILEKVILNIADFSSGIYIIKFEGRHFVSCKKIIKH